MSYEFFFSYTRGNNDDYLRKFFKELSDDIRERRGLPPSAQVGFFDQQDIELGDQWEETIEKALQRSKVMVCLYSPGYFNSEYCGKEWHVFHARRELYVQKKLEAGDFGVDLPPVIKPVLWIPFALEQLTAQVPAIQYIRGNPDDVHNKEGLKYVLKQIQEHRSVYNKFLTELAKEIIQTADNHPLPPLENVPPLKQIASAFAKTPKSTPPQASEQHTPPVTNPKHVRFVIIAADPNKFGDIRSKEPYLEKGGEDWKPYFPNERYAIGPYVQHIASDRDLGFTSDMLAFSPNLKDEIEKAWEERKIIILLVDSWSVDYEPIYQNVLQGFDKENYINCSVIVPWNDSDEDTANRKEQIEQTLDKTFYYRRTTIRNPIFYRDSIRSADELRDTLREILVRIKAEMRNRAEVERPLPAPGQKPTIFT